MVAIHPSFDKLLTALRIAVANEYKLDKEQTVYVDILDAFRLSLIFYKGVRRKKWITKMHDYIFYSIAAILYFIIYPDVRRSDKKYKKNRMMC